MSAKLAPQAIIEDESESTQESETPQQVMLAPLEYTSLNLEMQEMRFPIHKPHHGAVHTAIECKLSYPPLENCEPYIAVVNSRCNLFANVVINMDGWAKVVTRNSAYFLWHTRSPDRSQRLWFRDVCLNYGSLEERSAYQTTEWIETMSKHASNIIDLSEVMVTLWKQGDLPRPFDPRPKGWLKPREPNQPKYHPTPIGSWKGLDAPPTPH